VCSRKDKKTRHVKEGEELHSSKSHKVEATSVLFACTRVLAHRARMFLHTYTHAHVYTYIHAHVYIMHAYIMLELTLNRRLASEEDDPRVGGLWRNAPR
jgi:hypothetical protein